MKIESAKRFFTSPKNIYVLGLIIILTLSILEVSRGRELNFWRFRDATLDFWNGISPYTDDWTKAHTDEFLYLPLFNILFTPFALLPQWLGAITWNIFNFSLYFIAIFTLPDKFSVKEKCYTFLFTLFILATTQLSFQYNVTVAYLFIFAFSLLERGKGGWAVLLILISGFTKVYGIFELGLLLCYPHLWRNIGYFVLLSILLLLLPLVNFSPDGLIEHYTAWVSRIGAHGASREWYSIFFLHPIFNGIGTASFYTQIGSLITLIGLFIANYKSFNSFAFRVESLGILMSWIILFGTASETHTYVIALLGYSLWYWSYRKTKCSKIDTILYWAIFIILTIIPVDILCPSQIKHFIFDSLQLNLWIFTFAWLRMCYITLISRLSETKNGNRKSVPVN